VLRQSITPSQRAVVTLMQKPPYRVLCKSANKEGKTFLAACLTSWHYDCFTPSLTITTAPTREHVCDVLWKELRVLRANAGLGGFVGAEKPEMKSAPDHLAKGLTAAKGEAYHGRHQRRMLFIMDEAVAIERVFWEGTQSMFKPDGEHFWLCFFNPTDTSSQARFEEDVLDADGMPTWHRVRMDALEHPNVLAELEGREAPFPSAVSLRQVNLWVQQWCERVPTDEREPDDLEWPPGSGNFYREGPIFEARARGRWPRMGSTSVWSDIAWERAIAATPHILLPADLPVIGCDVGFEGEDWTEMHVRWGTHSQHHERHNGWLEDRTAGRLKQLANEWADRATEYRRKLHGSSTAAVKPQDIPVRYDGDGRGAALKSHKGDYRFIPVCASSSPVGSNDYPNRRSELWFSTVNLARAGKMSLSKLPRDVIARLADEARAPRWKLNSAGQLAVEKKVETKARLMRSPDGMDSVNIAFSGSGEWEAPTTMPMPERPPLGAGEPQLRFGDGGKALAGSGIMQGAFGRR
jgi:hypothetical protein